ncbi:MAG TPA: hypothetical protein VH084_29915 [Mycobacterium sp.]|nr:hypothetical protein [Mycobacterium sp.]
MTRSRCADCNGLRHVHTYRMAVFCGGLSLEQAIRDPDRLGHGCQATPCQTCDGEGWVSGFTPPL